jgi:Flp pilus assembly protein TadD
VALRPGDWTGYKELGAFYRRRQEFAKAVRQFEDVVRLTPDNALGYVNLGVLQHERGDDESARKNWERALALDPERLSALSNLGILSYLHGDYRRAIELLQRALKVNERSHFLWHSLAGAHRGLGEAARAAEAGKKAVDVVEAELKVNPNNGSLTARLVYYKALAGQRTGLETLIEEAQRLAPDDADALAHLAEAYHAMGNRQRAQAMFRRSVEKGLSRDAIKLSAALRELDAGAERRQ